MGHLPVAREPWAPTAVGKTARRRVSEGFHGDGVPVTAPHGLCSDVPLRCPDTFKGAEKCSVHCKNEEHKLTGAVCPN